MEGILSVESLFLHFSQEQASSLAESCQVVETVQRLHSEVSASDGQT